MKTFKDNKITSLRIHYLDNGYRSEAAGTCPENRYSTIEEDLFHADFGALVDYLFNRYGIDPAVREAYAETIINARFTRLQKEVETLKATQGTINFKTKQDEKVGEENEIN